MQPTYFSDFGVILLFLIGGLAFVALGLLVSRLIRPHRPNPEKLATYESGEEALGSAWGAFNPRFYVIALVFLLFEVELAFLFPWAVVFGNKELVEQSNGAWGWFALAEMFFFVLVLALGLAYAWRKGHLDWVKPKPVVPKSRSTIPTDLYEQVNERYRQK